MSYKKSGVSMLSVLLLAVTASANATVCTYKVSRDFRNIQAEFRRNRVSTSDVVELLSEIEDSLVRKDPKTNTIEPGLASTWEYDAASNSFVFTLDQNCRWSDGSALVADDIVYGFRELYSNGVAPNIGGNLIKGAEDIIGKGAPINTLQVKAIANDKVKINIVGDPSVALLYFTYVSYSPLPSHVINAEHVSLVSPNRQAIGPFRVRSVAKDIIVLDRNPYYCSDRKIGVDRIELVNRKEGYWEFSEFMAGRLDMVRYTPEKQLQTLQQASLYKNSDARVEFIEENRQTYLVLNPLHDGFAKTEIRRKLLSAIDYANLVDHGNSISKMRKSAETLFYDLPNYANYKVIKELDNYKEGIHALRNTMEEYGYNSNNRLKASIITYPLEGFETVAKMLSSMLKQAHFDITFVKSLSNSEVIEHAREGRYEMYFFSWILDYTDPQSSLDGLLGAVGFLFSEENMHAGSVKLTEEFIKPIKLLLVQLKQSRNKQTRFKTLQRIEKLIVDSGLIIPIYTERSAIVVSSRISALEGQFPHSRVLNLIDCNRDRQDNNS